MNEDNLLNENESSVSGITRIDIEQTARLCMMRYFNRADDSKYFSGYTDDLSNTVKQFYGIEHSEKVALRLLDEKAWSPVYQFNEFYVTQSSNIEDLKDVTIKLGFQVFMSVTNVDTGGLESIEMMQFYLTTDDAIQAVYSVDNKYSLFFTSANTRVSGLLPF